MEYGYRARDRKGALVTGKVDAPDVREAKQWIAKQNLIVLEVKPHSGSNKRTAAAASLGAFFQKKVSSEDLMLFFQQLQTIYAVGVPLTRGLELIADQVENETLKTQVERIRADVSNGLSLSQALGQFPNTFDRITINLIQAGESSGQLDEIMDRIARSLEQRLDQNAKIKSATFYPKIVLGMIVVVFSFVVYFIIPKFKAVFSRFGGDLPTITKVMVAMSDFAVSYWYILVGLFVGGYFAFQKFLENPKGRRKWDTWILKMPVFGNLFLQNDVMMFCSTFELLIRSGIPAMQSLGIVKGALSNTLLQEDVARVQKGLESGETIRDGLAKSPRFPKTATNLIGIGEEAGALEKSLNKLTAFYKLQVDFKLGNLSKAIEPVLLVVVFGMVLALALAVFLPMWKMNSLMKK